VFLVVAGTCFFANYLLSEGFGLYEDDYWLILPALGWRWSDLLSSLESVVHQAPQGRPLGHLLNLLLAYATGTPHSLLPAYLTGWLILSLNGFLVSRLLRPLLGPFPSLIAALVYVTYAVDASKMILMHRAFLHLSTTELLGALWLFQRGWPVASYVVAVCALVSYESFYLPFVIAPLLCLERERRTLSCLGRHVVIVALIALCVVAARYLLGEEKATVLAAAGPLQLMRMVTAPWFGAGAALWALIARPIDVVLSMSLWLWLTAVFGAGVLWVALGWAEPRLGNAEPDAGPDIAPATTWSLAFTGLAALAVTYVLAFRPWYYPPITNIGRLSGVHAAGAFGGSLFVAALVALGRAHARRMWLKPVCVVWLGLLVAYGVQIQYAEYLTSWALQRTLWRSVVHQSLDATDGTIVVLDSSTAASRTRGFVTVLSAVMNYGVLSQFLGSPAGWRTPPVLTCNIDGYNQAVEVTGDGVVIKCPGWWGQWPTIRSGEFIRFRYANGAYERVSDDVVIAGHRFTPKPIGPSNPELRTSRVYRLLLETNASDAWFRFGRTCWEPTTCDR